MAFGEIFLARHSRLFWAGKIEPPCPLSWQPIRVQYLVVLPPHGAGHMTNQNIGACDYNYPIAWYKNSVVNYHLTTAKFVLFFLSLYPGSFIWQDAKSLLKINPTIFEVRLCFQNESFSFLLDITPQKIPFKNKTPGLFSEFFWIFWKDVHRHRRRH